MICGNGVRVAVDCLRHIGNAFLRQLTGLGDDRPGADRIHAQFVAEPVQTGDLFEIVDEEIRAKGPEAFVLRPIAIPGDPAAGNRAEGARLLLAQQRLDVTISPERADDSRALPGYSS